MDIPDILSWKIIKWVLIVLVAGFIGQFGKSFAQQVIGWFRRKKLERRETLGPKGEAQISYSLKPSDETQIQEENRPPFDSRADAAASKLKKKETKALLKAKKKEAKRGGV